MPVELCDDYHIDFEDRALWSNDIDDEMIAEIMYMYDHDKIPAWWKQRMRPQIIRNIIEESQFHQKGIVYYSTHDEFCLSETVPFGQMIIRGG